MLTCKLLLATAEAIVDVGPDMPQQSYAMAVISCIYCQRLLYYLYSSVS